MRQFISSFLLPPSRLLFSTSFASDCTRDVTSPLGRVALDASAICNVNFVGAVRGGPGCVIRKCVATKSSVRLSTGRGRGEAIGRTGRRRDRNRRGALVVSIRRRIPAIRCYRMRNRTDSRLHTSAYPPRGASKSVNQLARSLHESVDDDGFWILRRSLFVYGVRKQWLARSAPNENTLSPSNCNLVF